MTSIELNEVAKPAATFRAILRYCYAGTAVNRHIDPRGCCYGGLTSDELRLNNSADRQSVNLPSS